MAHADATQTSCRQTGIVASGLEQRQQQHFLLRAVVIGRRKQRQGGLGILLVEHLGGADGDLLAARIRELARENEIPMVENRPLARALHDVAELDRPIPVEYWEAVAAIIGYIMDLERNIRRTPPEGSSLREEA